MLVEKMMDNSNYWMIASLLSVLLLLLLLWFLLLLLLPGLSLSLFLLESLASLSLLARAKRNADRLTVANYLTLSLLMMLISLATVAFCTVAALLAAEWIDEWTKRRMLQQRRRWSRPNARRGLRGPVCARRWKKMAYSRRAAESGKRLAQIAAASAMPTCLRRR